MEKYFGTPSIPGSRFEAKELVNPGCFWSEGDEDTSQWSDHLYWLAMGQSNLLLSLGDLAPPCLPGGGSL